MNVKKGIISGIVLGVLFLSACSSGFNIVGMWKSSSGTTVSFNKESVSASLFGFKGGPDGNYSLSEKSKDNTYTLYGSHITGGEVEYSVEVTNKDEIVLTLLSKATFAPSKLTLTRQ